MVRFTIVFVIFVVFFSFTTLFRPKIYNILKDKQ